MKVTEMNRTERRAWARKLERDHRRSGAGCPCKLRRLTAVDEFIECGNCHQTWDILESPFFETVSIDHAATHMLTMAEIGSTVVTYVSCPRCGEDCEIESVVRPV